jgi:NAD-dependent SIR2 family protein deacetylase
MDLNRDSAPDARHRDAASLARFITAHPRLTLLSGAGCSTASGIPEYRDDDGNWKYRKPMLIQDFVGDLHNRQRYWAQSFSGWQRISVAIPNAAHHAIATLEEQGYVKCVVTQNVDNLHRAAGSKNVIDLHGVLHNIRCLDCRSGWSRHDFQEELRQRNPEWTAQPASVAPDGDARLSRDDFATFVVPDCYACGGVLKPDVVFFGESVPAGKVSAVREQLSGSDALLVVGSSLMVFSGFRFARDAKAAGLPIVILNRGATRADDIATLRLRGNCADSLAGAVAILAA